MNDIDVINENFKVVKDFSVVTGVYPTDNSVFGLFARMQDFTDIDVTRVLNLPLIKINDRPFGSIEFNSRYGDIELSTYAKNIIELYGYEISNNVYRPTVQAVRHFTCTLDKYFTNKWNKLYETTEIYDYRTPFDITLTESLNISKSINTTKTVTGQLARTTNNNSNVTNNTSTNSIYPFGNNSESPTDKNSQQYSDNSNSSTNDNTNESIKDIGTNSDTHTRTYNRKGNVGNISLSRLTDEERKTSRYIIVEEIFKDIADILGNGCWK